MAGGVEGWCRARFTDDRARAEPHVPLAVERGDREADRAARPELAEVAGATVVGIDPVLGISFGLMAFTTFVYDTLDVCTRLGRYIVQELTGWHDTKGRWLGTLLTAGTPFRLPGQGRAIEVTVSVGVATLATGEGGPYARPPSPRGNTSERSNG